MTRMNVLLISPGSEPRPIYFNVRENTDCIATVADILDAKAGLDATPLSSPGSIEGQKQEVPIQWGVMMTAKGSTDTVNESGVKLLTAFGNGAEELTCYGRAIVVGSTKPGDFVSLSSETNRKVSTVVNGGGRKRKENSKPKRPQRPFDLFNIQYQAHRRRQIKDHNATCKKGAELKPVEFNALNNEVCLAWRKLKTPDKKDSKETDAEFAARKAYFNKHKDKILAERKPYDDEAKKDMERFQKEKASYDLLNPNPPTAPLGAFPFFCRWCKENGTDRKAWKTMSDEAKQRFVDESHHDLHVRFQNEKTAYQEYCTANGLDYNEMTKKKPKIPVVKRPSISIDLDSSEKETKSNPKPAKKPRKAAAPKKNAAAAPKKSKKAKKVEALPAKFDDSDSD